MPVCGIDGIKGGWVIVEMEDGTFTKARIVQTKEIPGVIAKKDLALIDIPIGICEHTWRNVDAQAKKLLAHRHASVFAIPPRAVIQGVKDYKEALNRSKKLTGKGFSKQAWNILPKIMEVEELLLSGAIPPGRLRETHPELCFLTLNHSTPLPSKHTEEGKTTRMKILQRYTTNTPVFINKISNLCGICDIMDAMVCALCAELVLKNGEKAIGGKKDSKGLVMAIVLPQPI